MVFDESKPKYSVDDGTDAGAMVAHSKGDLIEGEYVHLF